MSSNPSPCRWQSSLTTTATSAFFVLYSLVKSATATIDRSPVLRVAPLGHEDHLAVVINEADAGERLVSGASAHRHHLEIALVDCIFREPLMKGDHQRLVFRANRTDGDSLTRFRRPIRNVLQRIRTKRGPREIVVFYLGPMERDPRVERHGARG